MVYGNSYAFMCITVYLNIIHLRTRIMCFNFICVRQQTEKLLSLVDQSPNSKMQEALNAPMKALVDDSLLKHSNLDVKVSVAICICEITRITAPEAPYSDEEMKV